MKDGPGRRQWETVKEKGCGCARYLPPPPPVFRQSRVMMLRPPLPTLVIPKPERLWRGVWGTGETCVCVFYLDITFFSLLYCIFPSDWAALAWLFGVHQHWRVPEATTRCSVGACFGSCSGWQSGSFRIFALPDTTIHLASQHISDTEHSIWRAPFGRLDLFGRGFPGWDGGDRVAGRQGGRLGSLAKGKIVHHGLMGYDRIPQHTPPLVEFYSYFFLVTLCYLLPLSCHLVFFSLLIWRGYLAGVRLRERRRVRVWSPTGSRMEPAMGNKQK